MDHELGIDAGYPFQILLFIYDTLELFSPKAKSLVYTRFSHVQNNKKRKNYLEDNNDNTVIQSVMGPENGIMFISK